MNDLRTKVTDLPLLEDSKQIDTVLALGKDGKMYRIDGSNIGGGSKLTPIECNYIKYNGYCELVIKDSDLIDNLLETGGTIHTFINPGIFLTEIKMNIMQKNPDIEEKSISISSYKNSYSLLMNDSPALIGISYTQVYDNSIVVMELYDNSELGVPQSLDTSYKYSLKLYGMNISDIQGALDELSKETVNEDSEYLQNYNNYNNIVYGKFLTNNFDFNYILNVFIEDRSILSEPCLIVRDPQ